MRAPALYAYAKDPEVDPSQDGRHGFEDLGLSAVWCGHYEGNDRSQHCMEKCGFVYHHTARDVPCRLMGDVRTERASLLTRERWLAGRR